MSAVLQPDGVAGRVSDPDLGVPVHRPVDYRDEVDVRAALAVVPPGPGTQQYHALGVESLPEVPGCGDGPRVGSAALSRQSFRCHDRSNAVVFRFFHLVELRAGQRRASPSFYCQPVSYARSPQTSRASPARCSASRSRAEKPWMGREISAVKPGRTESGTTAVRAGQRRKWP